jgi:hypothetical protein
MLTCKTAFEKLALEVPASTPAPVCVPMQGGAILAHDIERRMLAWPDDDLVAGVWELPPEWAGHPDIADALSRLRMQRDGPAHYVLWPAKDAGQPFLREDGPSFTSDKVMLRVAGLQIRRLRGALEALAVASPDEAVTFADHGVQCLASWAAVAIARQFSLIPEDPAAAAARGHPADLSDYAAERTIWAHRRYIQAERRTTVVYVPPEDAA